MSYLTGLGYLVALAVIASNLVFLGRGRVSRAWSWFLVIAAVALTLGRCYVLFDKGVAGGDYYAFFDSGLDVAPGQTAPTPTACTTQTTRRTSRSISRAIWERRASVSSGSTSTIITSSRRQASIRSPANCRRSIVSMRRCGQHVARTVSNS